MTLELIFAIICSYLLGSIPTAYIYGKLSKNIDIREHGSGNVGATNVFRVLGKGPGIVVLIVDIIKGIIPLTFIAQAFHQTQVLQLIILAIAVVCGHNWTIFLGFKGGKGIATSLGVLIGLAIAVPGMGIVLAITFGVWMICFLIGRYVSLASIVASCCLPIAMILVKQENLLIGLGFLFAVFVVVRHKANISRLKDGTESRVSFKK